MDVCRPAWREERGCPDDGWATFQISSSYNVGIIKACMLLNHSVIAWVGMCYKFETQIGAINNSSSNTYEDSWYDWKYNIEEPLTYLLFIPESVFTWEWQRAQLVWGQQHLYYYLLNLGQSSWQYFVSVQSDCIEIVIRKSLKSPEIHGFWHFLINSIFSGKRMFDAFHGVNGI